jgi:hypothetical protein
MSPDAFPLLFLTFGGRDDLVCDEAVFVDNTIFVDGTAIGDLARMSFGRAHTSFRVCRVGLADSERFEISHPEAPRGELLFGGINQVGADRTRIRLHLVAGGLLDLTWEEASHGWRAPSGVLYPRLALTRAGARVVRPHPRPGPRHRLSPLAR